MSVFEIVSVFPINVSFPENVSFIKYQNWQFSKTSEDVSFAIYQKLLENVSFRKCQKCQFSEMSEIDCFWCFCTILGHVFLFMRRFWYDVIMENCKCGQNIFDLWPKWMLRPQSNESVDSCLNICRPDSGLKFKFGI